MSAPSPPTRILVIDDDLAMCRLIAEVVTDQGRDVRYLHDGHDAIVEARREAFDLVISDINLNRPETGLDILRACKQANPACEVLLISAFGSLETAVQAIRAGAFDYISKPFDIGAMKSAVTRALARRPVPSPVETAEPAEPASLVGRTAAMLEVYKHIAHAADLPTPVLIAGESGTGKELVARAIHANGRRRSGRPFVAINCGAVPETLLESELFGHVRGSFTGATADHEGVFQQAHLGTVFLDEIGETSPAMQVKLLRVLQDGEVRPLGATRTIQTDARVVAATNLDLDRAIAEQRFRHDLYYRLGVIVIRLPALRDRSEDIPLLIEQFLRRANAKTGRQATIAPEAVAALTAYRWPGNTRELENTVERLVVFSRGRIDVQDLPPTIVVEPSLGQRLFSDLPTLDELERRYVLHVLEAVGGNRTRAAEALGIDRRTLYRMAKRFGIDMTDDNEHG